MTTRRKVLQAAMALAAAAAPGTAVLVGQGGRRFTSSESLSSAPIHLYKVAYDGRFAAGRLFGDEARRLGAQVYDIAGDITALWYNELYHRWQREPAPVAGMTTFASLLSLTMMASVSGLRVIYRAHHHLEGDETQHRLFGPRTLLARIAPLRGAVSDWAPAAARILVEWPSEATAVSAEYSSILEARRDGVACGSLISWMLAIVPRAASRAAPHDVPDPAGLARTGAFVRGVV